MNLRRQNENGTGSLRKEEGFTLVELLIVATLTVFVVVIIYNMVVLAQRSQTNTGNSKVQAGDVTAVLDIMDRYLSESTDFTQYDTYTFGIDIPTTNTFGTARLIFAAHADGSLTLYRNYYLWSDTLLLSTRNANVSSNTGFFTFYDKTGAEMSLAQAEAPNMANVGSIRITIAAKNDDGTVATGSRRIYLRNIK